LVVVDNDGRIGVVVMTRVHEHLERSEGPQTCSRPLPDGAMVAINVGAVRRLAVVDCGRELLARDDRLVMGF
jgi:hypothetical protein